MCRKPVTLAALVVIGSANVNERSMCGMRDTEVAVMAWQPSETQSRGDVFAFRMSLWREHLGYLDDTGVLEFPESAPCVVRVSQMAEANWTEYVAREPTRLRGHLLPYPVVVEKDGTARGRSPIHCVADGRFNLSLSLHSTLSASTSFSPTSACT